MLTDYIDRRQARAILGMSANQFRDLVKAIQWRGNLVAYADVVELLAEQTGELRGAEVLAQLRLDRLSEGGAR